MDVSTEHDIRPVDVGILPLGLDSVLCYRTTPAIPVHVPEGPAGPTTPSTVEIKPDPSSIACDRYESPCAVPEGLSESLSQVGLVTIKYRTVT